MNNSLGLSVVKVGGAVAEARLFPFLCPLPYFLCLPFYSSLLICLFISCPTFTTLPLIVHSGVSPAGSVHHSHIFHTVDIYPLTVVPFTFG